MLRNSSEAFREISFIAAAWLKGTHYSIQTQEARLEQVEQDVRDQEREIQANTADISCMQTNHELRGERLERLEGIVHSQGQALLAQERRLKEIEEGRKRTEEELRVQAQGLEDCEPTGRPKTCPASKADGLRASTGASVDEVTSQGRIEGALKGPSGARWLPPQLQGSGPRRGWNQRQTRQGKL